RLGDGADVLVLDEPTAHLDADNAGIVIDMIAEAAASHRVILASHDERVSALAETEIRPIRTRGPAPNDSDPAAPTEGDAPAAEGLVASTAARQDVPRAATAARALESALVGGAETGAELGVEPKAAALRRRWSVLRSSLPLHNPTMALAALSACDC